MSDKPHPDDPKFDWLYGGRGSEEQRNGSDEQPGDPDATQIVPPDAGPGSGSGSSSHQGGRRPDSARSEPTQILGAQPSPDQEPGQPGTGGPRGDEPPGRGPSPSSFGGTYAAPGPPRPPQPAQQGGQTRFTPPPPGGQRPPGPPPGTPAARPTPPQRPKKRRNWWLRGILLLVLAWLAFMILVPVYAYSQVSKVDAEPDGERPSDTPGTTYLLVGSDSREGLSEEQQQQLGTGAAAGQRTDTIILLHVPSGDGPNLLLSIPRDSLVDIPGEGENKINAAYAFGGPTLLVETVESATGVHVDNYVEIGFGGFVELVDAVGGVEVCPRESVSDPKAGNLELDEGCQEIDGVTALGYARSRAFTDGDISRAEHQREVISAVGSEAASWQTLVLPWRYWSLNMSAAETLTVGENVGPIDLARFGWAMARIGGSDAKRCVVPFTDLGASTSVGSVVIWDEAKADAVFSGIREDDTASIECSPR